MDTTIRNIDDDAYRALKSHAALHGQSVGEALSDLIRRHIIAGPASRPRRGSLADVPTFRFPPGNERLSSQIDEILYGA